jgi:hypothetical protein
MKQRALRLLEERSKEQAQNQELEDGGIPMGSS